MHGLFTVALFVLPKLRSKLTSINRKLIEHVCKLYNTKENHYHAGFKMNEIYLFTELNR